MRLLAIVALALSACVGDVTAAAAVAVTRGTVTTESATSRGFPQECISTSRVTEKVASRTVTTTLTTTALPASTSLTAKYGNSATIKNGTATASGQAKLWASNSTSISAPSTLCFPSSASSSKCPCISISRVTTTSTVKSSTATVTVTSVLSKLSLSSSKKPTSSSRVKSASSSTARSPTAAIRTTSTRTAPTGTSSTRTASKSTTSTRTASKSTTSTRTTSTKTTSKRTTSTKTTSTRAASSRTASKSTTSTRTTSKRTTSKRTTSKRTTSTRAASTRTTSTKTASTRTASTSASSTTSSTTTIVYVVNTTTLITVTAPTAGKPSDGFPLATNTTTGRYLNSTRIPATTSQTISSTLFTNTTSFKSSFSANVTSFTKAPFLNTTTLPPHNISFATASSTKAPFLNTTSLFSHNISLVTGTGSPHFNHSSSTLRPPLWLNTTRSFLLPNRTITLAGPSGSSGYLLTTAPPRATGTGSPFSNSTTVRWGNSTSTATSTSTRSSYPTSCGKDSSNPPFEIQLSHPSSLLDGFLGLLSGRGILFTSQRSRASQFSVESTGHLCVVGLVDGDGMPYVAAVGAKETARSAVWLVSRDTLEEWSEDYVALECENSGSGIECLGRGNETTLEGWVGCGVQLWLGEEGEE
ncbi:hypothetical protein QBC43DRAFT_370363, partial [Cladorrhinum sp. PSN259]